MPPGSLWWVSMEPRQVWPDPCVESGFGSRNCLASRPSIVLAAGEASGDLHGAALCRALATLAPEWRLTGLGGPRMAAAGMDVIADVTQHAVVGTTEALSRLPRLYRAFRALVRELRRSPPPRALVLIDFPEFNLLLARVARAARIPVVYFIPPQIWAWRRGRVRTIARLITRVLAVFPFEPEIYRAAGVAVEFIGHPLVDALVTAPGRAEARRRLGLTDDALVLGVLPGSRRHEIERLLPAQVAAVRAIAARYPAARFLLGRAPSVECSLVQARLPAAPRIEIVDGGAHAVMAAADLLLVTSGTATLEAALLGTPMVVCYRVSALSAAMGRLLVRIPWFSLANISLGRTVVPELFQDDASGARIGWEALRLLGDPVALEAQRRAFTELQGRFGTPGVGIRAARSVLLTAGAAI
jgi:lipid-A-disaccharide synthase